MSELPLRKNFMYVLPEVTAILLSDTFIIIISSLHWKTDRISQVGLRYDVTSCYRLY